MQLPGCSVLGVGWMVWVSRLVFLDCLGCSVVGVGHNVLGVGCSVVGVGWTSVNGVGVHTSLPRLSVM